MWEIALKAPHGLDIISLDDVSRLSGWKSDEYANINQWISSKFDNDFPNWIAYNDDVIRQNVSSTFGHCKGMVIWNDREIRWLVHSCPNFPESIRPLSNLPESACMYGQSFVFLSLPIGQIESVLKHLKIMEAHIYLISPDASSIFNNLERPTETFDVIKFTDNIWHIGKSRKWGEDLYDDGLFGLFGGGQYVETWMRPRVPDTVIVDNLEEIAIRIPVG